MANAKANTRLAGPQEQEGAESSGLSNVPRAPIDHDRRLDASQTCRQTDRQADTQSNGRLKGGRNGSEVANIAPAISYGQQKPAE